MSFSDPQARDRMARLGGRYLRALQALVLFSQRRAGWVIAAALILAAASAWYTATHFAITTDTSAILSRDLPFQRLQGRLEQRFPQLKDTAVIVIRGDTSDLAASAADRLAAWLRTRRGDIESVYVPGGGEFFRKNALLYLDVPALWSLSDKLSQAQPLISQLTREPSLPRLLSVLQEALERQGGAGPHLGGLAAVFDELGRTMDAQRAGAFHAMAWDELITGRGGAGDERLRFVIVKPHPRFEQLQPAAKALATIHQGLRALQIDAAHGVEAHVTGGAALDNDQLGTVSRGTGVATVLSLSLVLVLLIVGLRSLWQVLFTLLTLVIGLAWTAAFALAVVGPLNLISIAFAVLFIGLGVDFGIQFCMRYQEEGRKGRTHAEVLGRTALAIGGPLSLAAAAAALSFYSFVPTKYAGIVDLGIISGTSMLFALFTSVSVLPALLALRPAATDRRLRLPLAAHLRFRHPRLIVALFAALVAVSVPLVLHARFDFNPLHLQDRNSDAVQTLEYLIRGGRTSPYEIEALEPDLQSADRAARRLDGLGEVAGTVTLSSFVPGDQDEKLDIIEQLNLLMPPFILTPDAKAAPPRIAAALGTFNAALASFVRKHPRTPLAAPAARLADATAAYVARFAAAPEALAGLQSRVMDGLIEQLGGLLLALQARRVTLNDLPHTLRERYVASDGEARLEVLPAHDLTDNAAMQRFVDAVRARLPEAAGAPVMLVDGGRTVVQAFVESSLISVALITLLLALVLRDLVDVLMVLIPLACAAALTVASMELFGLTFSLANIIVLPLMIGLGVAFGIYLVMRWRSGTEVDRLLHSSTPLAVLFSALTTMSSFGSLAVAGDPGMSALSKTLSLGLIAVLLSILVLLPALLALRKPRSGATDQ